MEDERPVETDMQESGGEATPDSSAPVGAENKKSKSKLIIGIVALVAVVLVVAGLLLPPISLGERLGLTGGDETAVATSEPTTAAETAVPEAVSEIPGQFSVQTADGTAVNVTSAPSTNPADAGIAALPPNAITLTDLYSVAYEGAAPQGQISVAIPAGADLRATDLFGWDGTTWQFVASHVDGGSVVSAPGALHKAYALAQPTAPMAYIVGAAVQPEETLPENIVNIASELNLGKLMLVGNGELQGEIASVPESDAVKYLLVSNRGDLVDSASLAAFLGDTTAQGNQINALVNTVTTNGFNGINLDYQGVDATQKEAFTSFVKNLADALHAQGLTLAITLNTPTQAGNSWDTAGQDWPALGQIADVAYVQLPLDPAAYGESGLAMQLLDWAVRQISRNKMMILSSANAVSRVGSSLVELTNAEALAQLGELTFTEGSGEVEPETAVAVQFDSDVTPLEWDGASNTYRYSYTGDADQTYHIWLGNPTALAKRLEIGEAYNVRGLAANGLATYDPSESLISAMSVLGAGTAPEAAGAAIVWTVRDENDSVVASENGANLNFAWDGSATPGTYSVTAEFAMGDEVIPLVSVPVVIAAPVVEEEEPEVETAVIEPTEPTEPTTTATTATFDPGDADAVTKSPANVRTGPGLTYGTLAGGANAGTQVNIIGRNSDSTWYQVILPDNREGWLFGALLEFNAAFDPTSVEVVEVAAPVSGGDGGGGTTTTTAPPPPVSAPPVTNAAFELGGQTHTLANPQLMQYAGMNWVKFQHKWGPGNVPGDLAGRINQAHANGFKVLLSIPGSPYPSSIDFQSYVTFLGGVAALGPDAIEVWNEMNIDFEWPVGQIDPASYVNNMLAPAYNAIKSANPNVMVISGAPAPTGYFGGGCSANGCDDSAYLAGMAAAGAANYLDCVGVHYNAGATPPSQPSGHPAGNDHYSWHFQPTLNLYANSLGKPVCFTEIGYLSGEDYGGVPGRFSWAGGTSVQEHAQWLAQAVSMAANSGRVRMAIIFNVDFTTWGEDPQAGFAMIRKDGSCPACETLRSVMGGG